MEASRNNMFLARMVLVLVLMVVLWSVLAGSYPYASWYVGLPVVLCATAVSGFHPPPAAALSLLRRPHQLLLFALFFVFFSVGGGIDVARRVLSPRLPLDPDLIEYDLDLEVGSGRVLLVGAISLMPGTLVVDVRATSLVVHAIDPGGRTVARLRSLEHRIAGLYGVQLERTAEDG